MHQLLFCYKISYMQCSSGSCPPQIHLGSGDSPLCTSAPCHGLAKLVAKLARWCSSWDRVLSAHRDTQTWNRVLLVRQHYTNSVDVFWQNTSFDSRVCALRENDIVTLTTVSACRSGSPSISHVILGAGTEPQDSHSICCTLPAENAMPRLTLMWTFFGFTATWAMAKIKLGARDWMEQNYTHTQRELWNAAK